MQKKLAIAVAGITATVYACAIAGGLWVKRVTLFDYPQSEVRQPWSPPRWSELPVGSGGAEVRRGALLFNETPLYAAQHVSAKLSCGSCHAEGGLQPLASPMVGVPATFPQFNQRAGHVITLKDRIEECFVRSENGTPIDYDSAEMKALVAYIGWVSQETPKMRPFQGRGLVSLPELTPDPAHGAAIYTQQCAGCHGENGEGRAPVAPPLWGASSFNDGAGMHGVRKMAAFVQHNMPQNRMGILTAQDAYDVAAFVHAQPRPSFNPAYKNF